MENGFVKRFAAVIARPLSALLHSCGIMKPQVIVRVDGGVSSQMHFYLIGEWLREHRGLDVVYDLIWFDECGMDCDGRFVRNFDLLRLCPDLKFPIAPANGLGKWKTSLYRLLYKYTGDPFESPETWMNIKAPVYMDGYYGVEDGFYSRMREVFHMSPVDADEWNRDMYRGISNSENAVGMHVRRGDLTRNIPAYGEPATAEYFRKSVEKMQSRYGVDVPVYIFSDEPGWVRENLLHLFPEGNYKVLDYNGSDKGYLDLWLISACRHFITSTGSFGKFGALLSPRRGDVLLPETPENDIWRRRFQ